VLWIIHTTRTARVWRARHRTQSRCRWMEERVVRVCCIGPGTRDKRLTPFADRDDPSSTPQHLYRLDDLLYRCMTLLPTLILLASSQLQVCWTDCTTGCWSDWSDKNYIPCVFKCWVYTDRSLKSFFQRRQIPPYRPASYYAERPLRG
jgi:hypothetical protein